MRTKLYVSLLLAAFAFAVAPAVADATPSKKRGKAKYTRYCAACHGPAGKGDGSLAEALKTPPSDLTKIAKRNGGFDAKKVAKFIDGREDVRAHGPTQMPVWGTRFAAMAPGRKPTDAEKYVDRSLDDLVAYLKSIQRK